MTVLERVVTVGSIVRVIWIEDFGHRGHHRNHQELFSQVRQLAVETRRKGLWFATNDVNGELQIVIDARWQIFTELSFRRSQFGVDPNASWPCA